MKNFFLFLTLFSALTLKAEDIIVLRNGDIVKAIVKEVNVNEIKYNKASNPSGPLYTIEKSTVLSINYENGDKDVFESTVSTPEALPSQPTAQSSASSQTFIEAIASEDNSKIIDYFNSLDIYHKNKYPSYKKYKTTNDIYCTLGITPESILSDDNIEVGFEVHPDYEDFEYAYIYKPNYKIIIKNKTDKVIFIDVANSFRIFPNGNAESFFNGLSITKSSGSSGGSSLNLGAVAGALGIGGFAGTLASGIGIGGSKSSQTVITENESNIISIPPFGARAMPARISLNTSRTKSISNYEIFDFSIEPSISTSDGKVEKWAYEKIDKPNYSNVLKYYITYSTQPDFSTYSAINFALYIRGFLGVEDSTPFSNIQSNDGFILITPRQSVPKK